MYSLPSGLREWTHISIYIYIRKAKHTVRAATKQTPAAKHFITLTRHSSNGTLSLSLSLSVYIICVWNVLSLDVYLMLKFDFLQFLYPNEEKFSNLKMVHGIYITKKKKTWGSLLQACCRGLRNHGSMRCQVDTRHSEGSLVLEIYIRHISPM